ncbi:MAG: methionine--tRNA ligase [Nitrospirae bacterium]|nr:methionine--tRNA ligase [Nitrospirota bacterium]
MRTFYVTTPIYYVNDVPHIGHAYTTVAADVLARYRRLRGEEVFFLTGLDEHGQKVQQAAAKAGRDPQSYVDGMVSRFTDLWKLLEISNDDFVRTTQERHTRVVQAVLTRLHEKGEIYRHAYEGWYCLPDERFWTGKDLAEGNCPECGRPVEKIVEENYFFRMGKYRDRLKAHILENPEFIRPKSRRNEVLGFLEKPLGDLCISRPKSRLSWGIPLPFDPAYVTYVWLDALVNYISIPGYGTDEPRFGRWWPADVHLVGKDILTTHAVYWSTLLMALDVELPRTIFAHGWWTSEGEKISKSRGNVVDPYRIAGEFGVSAFRYFLLREVPFGGDGDFSRGALVQRINAELANDLGNLLSRTLTMIDRYAEGKIPEPKPLTGHAGETEIKQIAAGLFSRVEESMNRLEFHHVLVHIWELVGRTNRYIDEMAPWKLAKQRHQQDLLQTVLYTGAEALRFMGIFLFPFMPATAREIFRQLGLPENHIDQPHFKNGPVWGGVLAGLDIRKGESLFPRIEQSPTTERGVMEKPTAEEQKAGTGKAAPGLPEISPEISIEEFAKVDLRVGKILAAERVEKSKKLLKLQVDLGTEVRQVVAGIAARFAPEEVVGKTVVVVANLKPAKLMGIESRGMLLAAGGAEALSLVNPGEGPPPGTKVK